MRADSLTEGRLGPVLLRFAFPFLIASVLQALYGAADLFVVGQYADAAAVAAVSTGSQIMQTLTGIVLAVSMGGTVLIGHSVGEGDRDKTAKAIGSSVTLFVLLAAVLTPAMLLVVDGSVTLMQTPEKAVGYAKEYLFTCACGIPFIVGYNAVSGIFRGLGDSRTPVVFVAVACAVNVGADFLLVGGFGLGALGAALATIFAQAISFLSALVYLYKKGFPFPFTRRHLRPDGRLIRTILKVGLPLALQDALVNVSFLIITAIINTLGLVAAAAVGVVEKIIVFAMLPPSAFASAVTTMTAQNCGASKPERARGSLYRGVGYAFVFGTAVCVYCQFLPETLTSLFTRDPAVIAAAADYLRSYAIDCILIAFIFNMNAYFSGKGKAVVPMVHSLIATFALRIPLSLFLKTAGGGSLYIIGYAAVAASLLSVLILITYYLWERKTGRDTRDALA